jgi:SAM-dependent methyltransferase
MTIADALVAVAASDRPGAIDRLLGVLGQTPDDALATSLLAAALLRYLRTSDQSGVYQEPSSFQEFIDNGDNPNLYARTIDHLHTIHQDANPASLLDIGCGDGRVTAAVLGPGIKTVNLIEPSQELLSQAESQSGWPGDTTIQGHPATLDGFLDTLGPGARFALVQSTFAMHTTLPERRPALLSRLAEHTDRVVMVDFDVPAFSSRSPEHAAYAAARYQHGVSEYIEHPAVIDGFLMPVLVAQFDPSQTPMTFEQPAKAWTIQFEQAGFDVTLSKVTDYWWAQAFLLDATTG